MSEQHEQLDDGRLVERVLNGDREAFERLYDRHARRVRTVVWTAADQPSAVDDLIQECFLRAYRKLDQLLPRENFGPWLIGIARRVAGEKRRSLYRDRHRFVGTDLSNCETSAADRWIESPSGESLDDLDLVLNHVRQLPEAQRVALELFFLEERNVGETAELLGMSRSGVYALLKRACRTVAKSIERGTKVGD